MDEQQDDFELVDGEVVEVAPENVREVMFYGNPIPLILVDGLPYVAVRPIVNYLNITWAPQYQRIMRDDVLAEEKLLVSTIGSDKRKRQMVALPLDLISGWLFGISGARVKDKDTAERLKLYRKECFRILHNYFTQEIVGAVVPLALPEAAVTVVAENAQISALEHVREIGRALIEMADSQQALQGRVTGLESRVDLTERRVEGAARVFRALQQRIDTVEHRILPYQVISNEQAAEISLAVKRLGELLTRKAARASKTEKIPNYYSGIFMEIYNRTGAARYELIRVDDYQMVMTFLEDWAKAALGEEPNSPQPSGE